METKDTLTKKYIYEALHQLLIKHPYDDINVCDICEKAGVSRMSFYRNFKSKDELLSSAIEKILQNLKTSLQKQEYVNQFTVTKEIFATALKYKDALQSFKNTNYLDKFVDSIADKLFTFAPEDKINPAKKYIPVFYFSAIAGVLGLWLNNGASDSPEEMAKMICSTADFPIFTESNLHID